MDLVVGAEDVEGLTLVTAPGTVINGTVVSDTGEAFDFRPQQLQVIGARRGARRASASAAGPAARASATTGRSAAQHRRSEP